jgi:hypothetical protein
MAEQTPTEDEEAIPEYMWPTSYHDGHCYSRFQSTATSIGVLEKWQIRGTPVLSREIGWQIIFVSQKTSKEKPEKTGWGNSGG